MKTPIYYHSSCVYNIGRNKHMTHNIKNFDRHYFEKKGIPIKNKVISTNTIEVDCLLTNRSMKKIFSSRSSWLTSKNGKPIKKENIYYVFADAGVAQKLPFYIKPFGSTCSIIINNDREVYNESIFINDISDNNQAELIAVLTALLYLKSMLTKAQLKEAVIIVVSDSQLVLDQILVKDSIDKLLNDFDEKLYNTRTKNVSFFEEGFNQVLIKYKEIITYFKKNLFTVWCKGHEENKNAYLKDSETSFYVYYNDKCDTICSKLIYDKYAEYKCLEYMREDRRQNIVKKYNELIMRSEKQK